MTRVWIALPLAAALFLCGCSDDSTIPPKPDVPDAGPPNDMPRWDRPVPDLPPPDLPAVDGGPVKCGANAVLLNDCQSRCASPCACHDLLGGAASTPLNHCAAPCSQPASCPGSERCGFYTGAGQPVCLPESLTTPESYPQGASVDCSLDPLIGKEQCKGGAITQRQVVWLVGKISGCVTGEVLLESCAQGCSENDAGAPVCVGGSTGPDAGPATSDAGTVACCPAGYVIPGCYMAGGAKLPPHGCRMICCKSCHDWSSSTDAHGCKVWVPVK